MIISGSVYSCTNEVGNTYTEDQAAFVAASDIAAVKALTTETVSRASDKELLDRVAPVIDILSKVLTTQDEQAFIKLYNDLNEAIDKVRTVKVGKYHIIVLCCQQLIIQIYLYFRFYFFSCINSFCNFNLCIVCCQYLFYCKLIISGSSCSGCDMEYNSICQIHAV